MSRSDMSLSERLEIATTRTLYRALENTIESRFDLITFFEKIVKSTAVRERLQELEKELSQ
jgi:hypothetical protein